MNVLYLRIVELAAAEHGGPLNTRPGLWTRSIAGYEIRLNPTRAKIDEVHPFCIVVTRNGWPVFVLDPGGGVEAGRAPGQQSAAPALMRAVEAAIVATGATLATVGKPRRKRAEQLRMAL